MNRIQFLAFLLFILIFVGLGTLHPAILSLSFPLLLYLLVGLWRAPEMVHLKATRSLSAEHIRTGDQVSVTLKVSNQGAALEEVLLDERIPEGLEVVEGATSRLLAMPSGSSVTWSYKLRGRRGYYGLKKIHVTVGELLGLGRKEFDLLTEGQLFIQPPVLRLRRVSIQPRRTRIYSGSIQSKRGGSGVEFFDVRQYQQGDSPRWINWRATARHPQEVFSNEYELERAADVELILDGRTRTNAFGDRSLFEHSIMATAALADAFLDAGNRVGLLFYGRQIARTMPGYGKLQTERILHDLSMFEPDESQNINGLYIPRHLFPTRSQLVLVSPLISEDYDMLAALRMSGYQLLVVSPDPVSFEAKSLVETRNNLLAIRIVRLQRSVMLRRLRGSGVHVVDWDTSFPFEIIAKRELERRLVLPSEIHP